MRTTAQEKKACVFSCGQHFVTTWTVASQAPLSMGFSWQEYWNGLPCPSPRYLPNPGIKPTSSAAPALQADSLPLSHWGRPYMTALIILNIITSMNPPRKVRMCVQLWPTLCDHMDCSQPGSSIHGIFQARILEWVAISFSRESS